MQTKGASVPDQALAVPVEPVARLDPSGFDPSREFERRVEFIPAFDKRDPSPSKNYGICAMRIRFVLKGPMGAVQWMIGTPWYVASARRPGLERDTGRPMGWDLGYHSPRPLYDGATQMDSCDVLDGPCYYDGSGLNADILIEQFLENGDDYVWTALEAYYRVTFMDESWPFNEDGTLTASAIEAASAGETRSGSTEGESAVPEGQTPKDPTHDQ